MTFANTFANGLLFANKKPLVRVRVRTVRARGPGGVRVRVRVRASGPGGVRVRVRVRVRPIWRKAESAAERTVRLAAERKAAKRKRETAQAAQTGAGQGYRRVFSLKQKAGLEISMKFQ